MKINKIASLAILSIALISACAKYEPQYEGRYKDGDPTSVVPVVYEIVYVMDGQIFMASADLRHVKSLPTSNNVQKASINYAHDRIAYKPQFGGNLVVIDTAGTQLEVVPSSSNVTYFDWHANNQTLYMLEGSIVKFHGPSVIVPYLNLFDAHPYFGTNDYPSLAVLPDGSLAFGLINNSGSTNYIGFRIAYSPGSSSLNDHNLPAASQYPEVIRASEDGNRLFVLDGSTIGTFDSYFATQFSSITSSIRSGAMSPDGQKFVYIQEGGDAIILHNSGSYLSIGFGNVTDMDW
jgi:hypothetical protein